MSAIYKNTSAAVKVENKVSGWFCIKSGVKRVVFHPHLYVSFDGLCLKEHRKSNGRLRNQMGSKGLLDLDYAGDLSIQDEKVNKNECIFRGYCIDSFTYLGSNISKDGGCSEDVKSRIAEAQGVFLQSKKVWRNWKSAKRN